MSTLERISKEQRSYKTKKLTPKEKRIQFFNERGYVWDIRIKPNKG